MKKISLPIGYVIIGITTGILVVAAFLAFYEDNSAKVSLEETSTKENLEDIGFIKINQSESWTTYETKEGDDTPKETGKESGERDETATALEELSYHITKPQKPNYSKIVSTIKVAPHDVVGRYYTAEDGNVFVFYHNTETIGFEKILERGNYSMSFLIRGTYMPPISFHLYVNDIQKGDVIINAIDLWQGADVYLGELSGKTDIKLMYFGDTAKYNETTGRYYDDRNAFIKDISLNRVE
ncbi:MAG: hypothetical protein QXK37_05925 [Candidatus Woesearchaeota archaeon]